MIKSLKTDAKTRSEQRNPILPVMHGELGMGAVKHWARKTKKPVTCGSSKTNGGAASAGTSANQSCTAACSGAESQSSGGKVGAYSNS